VRAADVASSGERRGRRGYRGAITGYQLLFCSVMPNDRVPLYVRLPREQAAALDRLVDATGRRKQQLVSDLLSDQLVVGHAEVLENGLASPDAGVLTLDEAAALLRVAPDAVRVRAERGELPGRRFGEEWRFARPGLLDWLLAGDAPPSAGEVGGRSD
jgi:excisionase family DNA binding protein